MSDLTHLLALSAHTVICDKCEQVKANRPLWLAELCPIGNRLRAELGLAIHRENSAEPKGTGRNSLLSQSSEDPSVSPPRARSALSPNHPSLWDGGGRAS